jgi:hypothetical protein
VKFAELYFTEFRATAHKKSFTDLQKKKTRINQRCDQGKFLIKLLINIDQGFMNVIAAILVHDAKLYVSIYDFTAESRNQ